MADDRIFEALQDLERFVAAGINVVSSSPVMLQYPAPDDPLAEPVIARRGRRASPFSSTGWTRGSPTTHSRSSCPA